MSMDYPEEEIVSSQTPATHPGQGGAPGQVLPQYGQAGSAPEKKRAKKRTGRASLALVMAVVSLACGAFGGYAGSRYYLSRFGEPAVIYQNVTNVDYQNPKDVTQVVAQVENTVVEITTEQVTTHMFMQQYVEAGAGSGVILTANGYIVTNNHVVAGASRMTVTLKSGESYEAKLIATDAVSDLAVIKIDASDLQSAVLGDSMSLKVGESVVAIGNPLGNLGGTVTNGIISALDREISIDGQYMRLLQTNAAVNPGNSGGGLFNARGELIGIINAKSQSTSDGKAIEGIGFAIPVSLVKEVTRELIASGYVSGRPEIGFTAIAVTSSRQASYYGVREAGVYVSEVKASSGAEKAGIQPLDMIVSVNGIAVTDISDISHALFEKKAGDTVTVEYKRDSRVYSVEVTLLEARP